MMHVTVKELQTIEKIARRAVGIYQSLGALPGPDRGPRFATLAIADEVLVVHRDIVPLRLDELLAADVFNLMHDIAGIHHHLEHGTTREPACLTDCFRPRYAKVDA